MIVHIMIMFIQKFVNRKDELSFLNHNYESKKPFFIVIYGRRRVGKTELIQKFLDNKPSIFLLSTQEVEKGIISSFSEDVALFFDDHSLKINPFVSFKQLMEYFKEKLPELTSRTIIAIDEFPYLIGANKAIPSILQKYWDTYFKKSNLGFILCGSSISVMESDVLGVKSPLYGRRSGQWKVEPLKFKVINEFFPSISTKRCVEFFSISGGVPQYLEELDEAEPLLENIQNNIAKKGALLYEEADFLLKEELREPKTYASILKAIAYGSTKLHEISIQVGVERTLLTRYIERLEMLGFIEREHPITAKTMSRNTIYRINDSYLAFWFRFISPYKKDIERGIYSRLGQVINKNMNNFIGKIFEDISKELLLEMNYKKRLPFLFTDIGRMWGKVKNIPSGLNTYEIDLVALNDNTKDILFCECKWQELSRKSAKKIILDLRKKAGFVQWNNDNRKEHFTLIAKKIDAKDGLLKEGIVALDLDDF